MSSGSGAPAGEEVADVAIVGYGPVGQALAALLGEHGHRVTVLERHSGLYPLPRACHLDGETMRTLQAIGVADAMSPVCRPQSGYEFYAADGELMHRIDFTGEDGSGWAAGYFFFGPDLEKALDGAARQHPTVSVRFDHDVTGLQVHGDDLVDLTVRDSRTRSSRAVRARYVVGADGANSIVRQLVAIEWDDWAYEADWLVVDLRPGDPSVTHLLAEACQILDPRRPVSAFRWIGYDHARLEFMLLPGEQPSEMSQDERVWQLLEPFKLSARNCTLIRKTVYTFRSLLARCFAQPPVLLAGDAAHLMPPFLGQGMCAGLRDAAALSWRLDQALRAPVPAQLFSSYSDERRTQVRAVIEGSIAIGRILGATPDTAGEQRNAGQLRQDLAVLPAAVPALSAGAVATGDPDAGVMFPQFNDASPDWPPADVAPDGSAPVRFDDATGRRWRLISREPLDIDPDTPAGQVMVGCHIAPVVMGRDLADRQGRYGRWFDDRGLIAVLIRPDSLIYASMHARDELPRRLAELNHLMRADAMPPLDCLNIMHNAQCMQPGPRIRHPLVIGRKHPSATRPATVAAGLPAGWPGRSDGPLLTLNGVTKNYGGVKALAGASLTVSRPGEIHTLLGENGSGKSSLLGVLSGQLRPDGGQLKLDGTPVSFHSPADALAHGIAMVSQEVSVAPTLSITENLLLGRLPGRRAILDWSRAELAARKALDALGLAFSDLSQAVGELRPDQQQMIEIARAISMEARILILDEPTSSLTDDEVEKLFAAIRRLAGRGVAVLFVSHRLDEVFRISDAITVLRNGRTVASGPASEFTPNSLVSAMVGASYEIAEVPATASLAGQRAALSLSHLSSASAFADVDLTVQAGEIVGLAGLLGSGRSELLQAIFGTRPVSGGTISVDGAPYAPRDERTAIARRVAYLPPDRKTEGLMLSMSVGDNLTVVAESSRFRLGKPSQAARLEAFRQAESSVRLTAASADAAVGSLSGGNQQKVALAKWLNLQPVVLLLDEPTRGVDVAAKSEIHQRLRDAALGGLSILVSSSENPELLELCHRIVVMSRGRVIGCLDRSAATEAALAALAGGHQ